MRDGGGVDEVAVTQAADDELVELFQSWSTSGLCARLFDVDGAQR